MNEPHDFLAEIEAFLQATGMSIARFGRETCNDPSLIPQLRAGRETRSAMRQRIRSFMAQHV